MSKRWAQEEKDFVQANYESMEIPEVIAGLKEKFGVDRSPNSVKMLACRLGLKQSHFWSKEEEDLVRENYRKMDTHDLAALIEEKTGKKRGTRAITSKANHMDLGSGFYWTPEEVDILKACYDRIPDEEIAEKILKVTGNVRTVDSIQNKANKIGMYKANKAWTPEEIDCLETWFGNTPLHLLAKRVSKISGIPRTEEAVHAKLIRMGLSDSVQNTGKLTAQELCSIIGVTHHCVTRWIKKKMLRGEHRATLRTKKHWLIKIEDFWKFAEANKNLIDFSRIEPLSLIPEPEWFEEERRKDFYHFPKKHYKEWTPEEVHKLLVLYKRKMSNEEIAKELQRSEVSVRTKIYKMINNGQLHKNIIVQLPWREVEIELMYKLEKEGLTDPQIAEELGRTEMQIASKRRRLKDAGKYKGFKNRKVRVKNA
jgi:hypothetical protein